MDGSHSSRRYRDVKEVLKFFEEKIQQWNETIKNLNRNLEFEKERHWIPQYLYDQMAEMETTCANTKTKIPLENGNKGRPEHEQGNIPECCQERLKQTSAEIDQLEKNNATLIKNQQNADKEVNKLKRALEELQQKEKQLERNDKDAHTNMTGKEQSGHIMAVQQDAKPVQEGQSRRNKNPGREAGIPVCCQATLKRKSAEINRLKEENESLIRNLQIDEKEVNRLQKTLEEFQQKEKQLTSFRNAKGAQADMTEKEQIDPIKAVQQDAKLVEKRDPVRIKYPENEASIPANCQEMLKQKSAEIDQLKKINATLIKNQQEADAKVDKLQKTVEDLQQREKPSTGKDKDEESDATMKEQRNQIEDAQQKSKESLRPLKKQPSVANNMPKDNEKEKIREMEEKYDTTKLKALNKNLEKEKVDLEARIVKLKEEIQDLKERFEGTNSRDSGDAEQRRLQAVKHNEDEKRSNDLTKQQMQSQNIRKEDMTRNKQLEMQEKIELLSVKNISLETCVKDLEKEKKSFELALGEVRKEKDNLLLRLSKFAGDKLTENNPAIADLSDPNRPTKLAEFYSELYDNEWTDAFEALKGAGYEDGVAVETLKLTFLNIMQYCESKANHLMQKSTDAVNFLFGETGRTSPEMKVPSHATMPQKQAKEMGVLFREKSSIEDVKFQQRWMPVGRRNARDGKSSSEKSKTEENTKKDVVSKLNLLRKEMAIHMIPIVQKAYMETNWSKEYIQELKPFIMKCIFMSWMMLVQSPPMSLHKLPGDKEINFNKNFYKEYTCSGPLISYVVWPALLLNEGGPLLCKGVAEGKQPSN